MTARVRIGTRSSPLALWQANHVAGLLHTSDNPLEIQIIELQTAGDQDREAPLAQIGGQGLFTKEIQRALLDGRVDVAVHSLKDLPTLPVDGLLLAAVPKRGPTGDALIAKGKRSFVDLPRGALVATGSLRRRAQVLHRRPDLRLVEIRGNVETRLDKLERDNLDGIILAEAGLERLGLADRITEILDPSWMLPAVGQGALGLECRSDDEVCKRLLARIDDPTTRQIVLAERAMLRGLGGGCQLPIGAAGSATDQMLTLRGVVLSPDGSAKIEDLLSGSITIAESIGASLAKRLRSLGADRLLHPS
jgi:hydroxymethylbilane synthase